MSRGPGRHPARDLGSTCRLDDRCYRRHRMRVRGMAMRVRETEVTVRFGAVAARDRDVELRIAPHAVLADVEPGRLDLGLRADSYGALEDPQHGERRAERERADRDEAENRYVIPKSILDAVHRLA